MPKRVSGAIHDSVRAIHDWNVDVRKHHIYLVGEGKDYDNDSDLSEPGVEYQMVSRFIKNLQILSDLDPIRPILIHQKTCGGDWTEGMAVYDTIKYSTNPIVILNYTHARSMSSIFFQAADKRVMMPHSYFLFHEGTLDVGGTYKGVVTNVEWAKKEHPVMLDIYARRMKERGRFAKRSLDDIKKMLENLMDKKEDVFLSAQEAVSWGLADSIFDGRWDKLTKYLRKPKK